MGYGGKRKDARTSKIFNRFINCEVKKSAQSAKSACEKISTNISVTHGIRGGFF
jgi:hypothetical protein